MMFSFLTILWTFTINASLAVEMITITEGRLGIGVDTKHLQLDAPYLDLEGCLQENEWVGCSNKWWKYAESLHNDQLTTQKVESYMWSTIAALRGGDTELAYEHFKPLISHLDDITTDVGQNNHSADHLWQVLLLEVWLLNEIGASKSAWQLLKEVPLDHTDIIGQGLLSIEVLESLGHSRKMKKIEKEWIEQGWVDAWFWSKIVNLHRENQSDKFLTQYFERVIDSDRVQPQHYIDYITWLLEKEDIDGALGVVLKGLSKFPNEEAFRQSMVTIASLHKDRLENKVKTFPEHSEAQLLLGLVYFQENRFEDAISHLQIALSIGEHSIGLFQKLYQGWLALERPEEAWFVIQKGLEHYPQNTVLKMQYQLLSQSPQQKSNLLQFLEEKWGGGQNLSLAQVRQGYEMAKSLGDYKLANQWVDRENFHYRSFESLFRKGMVLTQLEKFDEAILFYQEALEMEPENVYLLNNLAWLVNHQSTFGHLSIIEQEESQRSALSFVQKAISLSKNPQASHFDTMADIYWNLGEVQNAFAAERKATILDSQNLEYQKKLQRYTRLIEERNETQK